VPVPLYTVEDEERLAEAPPSTGLNDEPYRTPWRRDYARAIHSPAVRRLQGKTQLFPAAIESDFFRNRLTHSLEVAQIAKSIAIRLNNTVEFLRDTDRAIIPDLVEFAGLCHDLGHPPFGHVGEEALDECMRPCGGFEGNAQTLRILARLEKRQHRAAHASGIADNGLDQRLGLNLSARTLASILKYDSAIPYLRPAADKVQKGYYSSEREVVDWIKTKVCRGQEVGKLKTVECRVMDIADDIAYSTYDLEDAFKAHFLTPLDLKVAGDGVCDAVAARVQKALGAAFDRAAVKDVLGEVFKDVGVVQDDTLTGATAAYAAISVAHRSSAALANDGYLRSKFTSALVGQFIRGVEFVPNEDLPPLSEVHLRHEVRCKVEVLKHFTFESLIMSPRLRVVAFRGAEIVAAIFNALATDKGYELLPPDYQDVYERIDGTLQRRVICDFIAGMTDRYALEFYGRLKSENPQTIFKPL
jgi:dGTPase